MSNREFDLGEDAYLVSGQAHLELAAETVEVMRHRHGFDGIETGIDPDSVGFKRHANGELYSRFTESIRGKDVIIMQSQVGTPEFGIHEAIQETALLVDAAKSAGAREIVAALPLMAYTRQDRRAKRGEPIGTRVLIRQLEDLGATRIMTVDLHSAQSQAIFNRPFDNVTAQPALRARMMEELQDYDKEQLLIIAPDPGATKMAARHSQEFGGVEVLYIPKIRDASDSSRIVRPQDLPGAVGRVCLMFDDMIDTAGSLTTAAESLHDAGAVAIYTGATHAIFSDPAIERLADSPIDQLFVTDTVPVTDAKEALGEQLQVVRIAPLLAETLSRALRDESISELLKSENYG